MTLEEGETRVFVQTRLQRGLSLLRALSLRERFWKSLLSSENISHISYFSLHFISISLFFFFYNFIVYIFILFYFINIQLNN